MKKVLLHICCGVCAFYSIERLKKRGLFVEGLFFNPNIYPVNEYHKRKKVAEQVANLQNIKLIDCEYDPLVWAKVCGEYGSEKEGGKRCLLCFEMRLQKSC